MKMGLTRGMVAENKLTCALEFSILHDGCAMEPSTVADGGSID